MNALWAVAAVGLGLAGSVGSAAAQYYGGSDGYRERRPDYREEYRERPPEYRQRDYGFDEREYLRCNPDVRRAVSRGQMESGAVHYRAYGRREGRRLSC